MNKLIGVILLIAAVFLIGLFGRLAPNGFFGSQKPSEIPAPTTTNIGGYGGQTVIQKQKTEVVSFAKRIYFSSANVLGYPRPYSKIVLYASLKEGEQADITGWKVKSNRDEFVVPRAVEIYEATGVLRENDIVLKAGDCAEFYSLDSPLGRNLRLNKCFGYLEETLYDFGPIYLPKNCPRISRSEIQRLSGECQSYILSLGSCRLPDAGFYNLLPGGESGNACRAFLQNIGYGSCFRAHRNDYDFFLDNWVVWLGRGQQILDSEHDYLRLYDREGNLISEYSY